MSNRRKEQEIDAIYHGMLDETNNLTPDIALLSSEWRIDPRRLESLPKECVNILTRIVPSPRIGDHTPRSRIRSLVDRLHHVTSLATDTERSVDLNGHNHDNGDKLDNIIDESFRRAERHSPRTIRIPHLEDWRPFVQRIEIMTARGLNQSEHPALKNQKNEKDEVKVVRPREVARIFSSIADLLLS